MEPSTAKNQSFTPMPMADLLPGLSGLLSKDAIQTLTAKKQPRATMAYSRTTEKNVKPLSLAELKSAILVLKPDSPRRLTQAAQSTKKNWNSSVKVNNKNVSHTANRQMKNNPVRKVLNFQPKPKAPTAPRTTMINSESSKFPKPEARPKKSVYSRASNTVRISGICNIPQTPVASVKPIKSRMTIANKENVPHQSIVKKPPPTPKSLIISRQQQKVLDTPAFNSSWKSGSDASFLQKEQEIDDVEEKLKAISEEPTHENIAELSPPVSTPFQEYFNHSSGADSSALYNDTTIMCFHKPNEIKNDKQNTEETKQDESVIVSLCDLFKKTTVNNQDNTELDNLLEIEKQIKNNIKLLTEMKEAELKTLENVTRLINEKRKSENEINKTCDRTLMQKTPKIVKVKTPSPLKSPIISRPCSVIKSPTYKIPKKNLNLRKKVICKSMPNVSTVLSPVKGLDNRALSMYMQMKDDMEFLSTPKVNRTAIVPDTPAVTSHNLQKQLDKLYGS